MAVSKPVLIDFPLNGEWITPNTPGSAVPSHGTTLFGESHAIDFVMVRNKKPYQSSLLRYLVAGLPLADFYGWGQPVHCALAGTVIGLENSVPERNPAKVLTDLSNMAQVTKNFANEPRDIASVAGNFVLVKSAENLFALYAHLQTGSVKVKINQKVNAGQIIANLGHSGNSTMPHLHFQLMDNHVFRQANGVPFLFREYQLKSKSTWVTVTNAVPKKADVIRYSQTIR